MKNSMYKGFLLMREEGFDKGEFVRSRFIAHECKVFKDFIIWKTDCAIFIIENKISLDRSFRDDHRLTINGSMYLRLRINSLDVG